MSEEPQTNIETIAPSNPPVEEILIENNETPLEPQPEINESPEEEEKPEEEAEPAILLDIDDKNVPLCPKTQIQASNFFLGDSSKYAVHCVLCTNSREEIRRMPQLNLSLSLVLNEKLAEQLFDETKFKQNNWEGQVDNILSDFRSHFDEQCKSFKEQMMERLQNESHEFMLKKIKSFLDQARDEYKTNPNDFVKLQELCSTFNDFLLLKKSDEVATAEDEMKSFAKHFNSMKKTMELNFKYLKTKIDNKQENDTMSKSRITEVPVSTFPRQMETSVVVNSTMPVNYGYNAPTPIKPNTPNKVIVSTHDNGFFDNITPQNGIHSYTNVVRPTQNYTQTETFTSSKPHAQSQQTVDVRGVSPGLRTIKKVRVSQRAGTPNNVKIIRKSINAERQMNHITRNTTSRNVSPYTETVSHVNGMKVIRRSISASNRTSHTRPGQNNSRIRTPVQIVSPTPTPSFNIVDEILNSSTVLTSPAARSYVKSGLFHSPVKFTLLYRGSQDGMNAINFHSKVDNAGPTLTVLRANETGAVFGGYNDKTWLSTENGESIPSDSSFLFSVDKRTKHELLGTNNHNAIGCYGKHGPVFGKFSNLINNKFYYNYDLFVSLGGISEQNPPSSSALGKTYKLPEGIHPDSNEAKTFLANASHFTIGEIEVYGISPKNRYN